MRFYFFVGKSTELKFPLSLGLRRERKRNAEEKEAKVCLVQNSSLNNYADRKTSHTSSIPPVTPDSVYTPHRSFIRAARRATTHRHQNIHRQTSPAAKLLTFYRRELIWPASSYDVKAITVATSRNIITNPINNKKMKQTNSNNRAEFPLVLSRADCGLTNQRAHKIPAA